MSYFKKHWQILLLVIIILTSAVLMIFSSLSDSMTHDEEIHITAGYLHVWRGDYRFNAEHPPLLNNLAGLFTKIAQPNLPTEFKKTEVYELFFLKSGNDVDKIVFWARLPFILLTLGLIYLVFLWAKTLFGTKAGLLAATLVAFSPNILAHGRLATTDIGLVFFFVLTCWLLRKYYFQPTWLNAVYLGSSLGLVILSKFSALNILPIILLGLILFWLSRKIKWTAAIAQSIIIFTMTLVIVWGIYAFSMRSYLVNLPAVYKTAPALGSKNISATSLKWLVAPFDKYAQGIQNLSQYKIRGWDAYLNGQVARSFWYYFPLVLLYKLTLPTLVLLLLSLIFFTKTKKGFFDEFLIIFPPLLFLAISMYAGINIGIRHILVILSFFFIFASRLMTVRYIIVRNVALILLGVHIIIGILAFPNYLAYFNQIAGGSEGGIKHLADSNLDWNQNIKRLKKYTIEKNIEKVYGVCWDSAFFLYYGIDYEPLPKSPVNNTVILCAHNLVIPPPKVDFGWVTKYPPDDIIANGIYIWRFDLKKPF